MVALEDNDRSFWNADDIEKIRVLVQTASRGALYVSQAERFAATYMEAFRAAAFFEQTIHEVFDN